VSTSTSVRQVPFHRPSFDDRELKAIEEVLRSGWITTGERTREFERRFAEYVGATHAVAVNSCTAALHLALAAEGIGAGDEVVTTPYTFVATVETICYLGAKPVFADVDPVTRNIDPEAVAGKTTPRTRAIVPVHIAGLPCDLDAIHRVADAHGIPVLEDAAHSLPAAYNDMTAVDIGIASGEHGSHVAGIAAARLGWTAARTADEIDRYRRLAESLRSFV